MPEPALEFINLAHSTVSERVWSRNEAPPAPDRAMRRSEARSPSSGASQGDGDGAALPSIPNRASLLNHVAAEACVSDIIPIRFSAKCKICDNHYSSVAGGLLVKRRYFKRYISKAEPLNV